MAEHGETVHLSETFSQGSEDAFDYPCGPCTRDNLHVQGVGYCSDCGEYMCDTCFKCHKKLFVSRDHTLLDQASMPTSTSLLPLPPVPARLYKQEPLKPCQTDSVDHMTRACSMHKPENIKFYCNEHGSLACSVCLSLDHRTCKDVSYIPDVTSSWNENGEFREVFDSLKKLQARMTFESNRAVHNEKRLEEMYQKALKDILTFKEKIIYQLDNLQAQVEKELLAIHERNLKQMTMWIKYYNGIRPDIDKKVKQLEENLQKRCYNQLFIDIKIFKDSIPELEDKVNRSSEQNKAPRYIFEENSEILELLFSVKRMGSVQCRQNDRDIIAKPLHDVNVKSELDNNNCHINAAIVLANGDIAISDHDNNAVKLIDPIQNTVTARLELDSNPFDLILVNCNTLAVTLPNVDLIELLAISGAWLSKLKTLNVGITCVAIEALNDTLITVCQNPGCVRLLNLQGTVLRTIDKDHFDRPLFSMPRSIAFSPDRSVVYVSEWESHIVTAVSLEGQLIGSSVRDASRRPAGLACDDDGSVFITYRGNHGVIDILGPTCKSIQQLIREEDGLAYFHAIALDRPRRKIYVSCLNRKEERCNRLIVFQLQYKSE